MWDYMCFCHTWYVWNNHHLEFLSVDVAQLFLILPITPWWIRGIGLNTRALINMINWGVTALCSLIPANWDFSHISPEQNACPNERGRFHSLICGQQQEPGPADLLSPWWWVLSRTQLLVQSHWIAAHPLLSAGALGFASTRPDPTGGEQARVSSQSQQPWTGLRASAVPFDHQPQLTWPRSSLAGLPVVSQGVSLPVGHCSSRWPMMKGLVVKARRLKGAMKVRGVQHPCSCSLI